METIAEEAGVTKPVLYACFPSKEALFRTLLEREEGRLREGVAAALPRELDFDDLESLLAAGFTALLRAAAEAPDSWRVAFISEHGSTPAIVARVSRAREQVLATLEQMAGAYLRQRGVEDIGRNAALLVHLLVAMGEESVRVLLTSPEPWSPEELGAVVGRLAARGPAGI